MSSKLLSCGAPLLAACACFSVLSGLPLKAQSVQGVVTGSITDASGAAIPGANLTLKNEGTAVAQQAASGSNGDYRFSLVPPGKYTLSVKASGFATKQVTEITVNASQTVGINVPMEVASSATSIEVTSQGSGVQTATSELATTVNLKTVESTPLLTRNVFDLTFLAPQVSQGMSFRPASGGARESGTAYLLNGADNNNNFDGGGFNITPPLESVGEFTVLTNTFTAQYGRGAGAIVSAVQKSGTNQIHGALYEFHRDRAISSNDFFSNRNGQAKPQFTRNQFGGEVDGPIVKDKTFFSFAFDRYDVRTGKNLFIPVPTPSEVQAISANAAPLARYYLNKYPLLTSTTLCANEAGTAAVGHIGCFNAYDSSPTSQNTYYIRIDQNFSARDRFSATANVQRYTNTEAYGGNLSSATQQPYPYTNLENYHQIGIVETHTFTPSLLNEFTAAHNRHYSNSFAGTGSYSDPQIIINGQAYGGFGFQIGPDASSVVQAFTQDRWQVQDNLGWVTGKHSLKFGGSWQYGNIYRNWDLGGPGYYQFDNTVGGAPGSFLKADGTIAGLGSQQALSNFQNDFPYFQELSIDPATGARANAYRHYVYQDSAIFINDDWKATRRLTFNLGLRWEHFGAPREINGILAQFTNLSCLSIQCITDARLGQVPNMWNPNYKDLAPRIGFAWDVAGNGKTSVRGGYGIFYDRIFDNIWSNSAWNPPFYALVDHNATSTDSIYYSVPSSTGPSYNPTVGPGRVALRTMDVALKDSSSQNFNLTIERQVGQSYLVRLGYQGSLGRHLPVLMNLNRYDGDAFNRTLTPVPPNTLYNGFNYRANNVNSNYNALVAEFQKRYSNGLQFQVGYTWSKLMDYGSDLFSGESNTGSYSQPYYFVSNPRIQNEYGPGGFDHTHAFKVNFVYDLPFLRNGQSLTAKVLGGWQLSGFYQGYSGSPVQIYSSRTRYAGNTTYAGTNVPENLGGDYNLDGANNDHPVYIGAGSPYSNNNPADGIFTSNELIGCGFPGQQSTNVGACNSRFGVSTPNAIFANPGGDILRYGDGRNTFRGPLFNNFDAAVSKTFGITERLKVQIRADAVNVLNHPNFNGIRTDLNSAQFGKAQYLVGDGGRYGPAVGSWSNGVARRFQFGARLTF